MNLPLHFKKKHSLPRSTLPIFPQPSIFSPSRTQTATPSSLKQLLDVTNTYVPPNLSRLSIGEYQNKCQQKKCEGVKFSLNNVELIQSEYSSGGWEERIEGYEREIAWLTEENKVLRERNCELMKEKKKENQKGERFEDNIRTVDSLVFEKEEGEVGEEQGNEEQKRVSESYVVGEQDTKIFEIEQSDKDQRKETCESFSDITPSESIQHTIQTLLATIQTNFNISFPSMSQPPSPFQSLKFVSSFLSALSVLKSLKPLRTQLEYSSLQLSLLASQLTIQHSQFTNITLQIQTLKAQLQEANTKILDTTLDNIQLRKCRDNVRIWVSAMMGSERVEEEGKCEGCRGWQKYISNISEAIEESAR